MIDFILEIIQDESVLERFAQAIGIYILVLWLLFPVWVFIDAKKKFNSTILAVIFALFILPLNIPGLIFYIIIRPEEHDDFDIDYDGEMHHVHGPTAHIPLANFTKNGQVAMSVNLIVNTDLINEKEADLNILMQSRHEEEEALEDMNVVDLTKKVEEKAEVVSQLGAIERVVDEPTQKGLTGFIQKASSAVKQQLNKLRTQIDQVLESIGSSKETSEVDTQDFVEKEENTNIDEQSSKKDKKNKKKKKRKR